MKREMMVSVVVATLAGVTAATVAGQLAHAQEAPRPVVCDALPNNRDNMTEWMQEKRNAGYDEFMLVGTANTTQMRGTICTW